MAIVILSIIGALVTLAAATAGLLISAQAEVDTAPQAPRAAPPD